MIRTRFAPSPTGRLHVGNARTALFNALFAEHAGGVFVLRIEDTDAGRSAPEHEAELLAALRWLGLTWAEGPDVGGGYGPYRQSERLSIYAGHFDGLQGAGDAYPCFCTAEELEAQRREAVKAGRPPRYPGTCARLPQPEINRRLAAGEPASLRFRVPAGREIVYRDMVRGEQRVSSDDLGDFVIRRTDGTPAFLFANAVDDALMGITHVLRGEDHVANTPRQLLLLEALQLPAPAYGHLPLVVDSDDRPLSKRSGGVAVTDMQTRGVLPGALCNYLLRLGHSTEESALLPDAALAGAFDPERLGRSPAHYDPAQLAHWQRLAVATMDAREALAWAGADAPHPDRQEAFWALVRDNVTTREALRAWTVAMGPHPRIERAAAEVLAAAPDMLLEAAHALSGEDDFKAFVRTLKERTGLAGKALFRPLRAALTGRLDGPELGRLWNYLDPDARAARFRRARSADKDSDHASS